MTTDVFLITSCSVLASVALLLIFGGPFAQLGLQIPGIVPLIRENSNLQSQVHQLEAAIESHRQALSQYTSGGKYAPADVAGLFQFDLMPYYDAPEEIPRLLDQKIMEAADRGIDLVIDLRKSNQPSSNAIREIQRLVVKRIMENGLIFSFMFPRDRNAGMQLLYDGIDAAITDGLKKSKKKISNVTLYG